MLNEFWHSPFQGLIPKEDYVMRLTQGEETGLVIRLYGQHHHVTLDFGIAKAVNILDDGLLLCSLPGVTFQNQTEIRRTGFPDTLYQVENGAYAACVQTCMTRELYEAMNLRQYDLVTLNYLAEIICSAEPIITVE